MIKFESPLVADSVIDQLSGSLPDGFDSTTLPILFHPDSEDSTGNDLKSSLDSLFEKADKAIEDGVNIIILSDRELSSDHAAIPALLACSGLHHHLIRRGTRTKVSLVLESGEPREVQHFALLLGYGVDLINPYLALQTVRHMIETGDLSETPETACKNFLKANLNGVIKTMSKMGISTIASYRGAQIFEAIGLNQSLIDDYFRILLRGWRESEWIPWQPKLVTAINLPTPPDPTKEHCPWIREEFINGDQAERSISSIRPPFTSCRKQLGLVTIRSSGNIRTR